ncbi:hypothetical protein [Thalassolituus oleivorans]|uniref:hypothetical protein n=1 Tax=Thalassolituus oleivorans TaxID=187493 RepID=UPI0023F54D3F|nr:hypothetical protein [Thalassolituus oleivorans]
MARKETPSVVLDHEHPIIREDAGRTIDTLAQLTAEQRENATALAQTLRYDGSLNPDALEAGIADARSRIAAELFGMGARLLLLKEQCEHGEFMERYQRLGLERTVVNKTMQATLKFSNSALTRNLEGLSKTKLFELIVLDEEEIKELEFDGSVRGISLDDIDRMSCSALRKQLRDAKAQSEAKDKLLENKNKQIDELHTKVDGKAAKLVDPDEHLQRSLNEVTTLTQQITTTLGTIYRKAMIDISDHHALHGGDSDRLLIGCMDQIDSSVAELREAFALINTDGWQQDAEEA